MLTSIAVETFRVVVLAAPYLLLGLAMAGLIHVLMPTRWVERFLGRPGLGGVATAGLVGIPLPICSCGVVPLVVELRRKGATRPASLSFLVTTPESGADSILYTWGLLGPVMAVARPIAAFATAMFGGTLAWIAGGDERPEPTETMASCCSSAATTQAADTQGSTCASHAPTAEATASTCSSHPPTAEAKTPQPSIAARALRYGFVDLLDDLAFWLLLGFVLAGLLTVLLPADLTAFGLGSGLLPMLLMLGVGVPLYVCASASTPIAAALMAKGLAPGAALVFLLAGPATNAASLVVLTRIFGRRFVGLYLAAVGVGALAAGLALEIVLGALALEIALPMAHHAHGGWSPWSLAAAGILLALLAASGARGALARGAREAAASLAALRRTARASQA
ncbi:MAG: SO_0444 family Cu/Zn efflux transporter [Acidobacteriota bacterium]